MAVTAVGINPNDQRHRIGTSLSIYSGSTPALYITFGTQSTSWLTANIWVTVDGVRRGGNEALNSFARIGSAGATGIARSTFGTPVQSGSSYVYSLALSSSSLSSVASLIGSLAYASRSYDALRLTIEVRVVWGSGSGDFVKGSQTCYLTFKPTYTASTARYTINGLEITYSANDWTRPNDRYQTGALYSGGALIVKSGTRGTCSGSGKLVIPRSSLLRIPDSGETLSGTITMRGSWQSDSSSLGTMSVNGVNVTNATTVKTPTITATAQADGVLVTVNDSGSGGSVTPTAIDVQMVGSDYIQDRATLAPGESHLFDAVPAGVSTTWQAVAYVAYDDAYAPTRPVSATAGPVSISAVDIVPSDGSGAIPLPYNTQVSRNISPEVESVKLAGRKRQTVGFGEGGSVSWSISATAVTDELPELSGLTLTDVEALASLPERGVCMLRIQDGRRAQVYISSASISRPIGGTGTRSISISADEVAS